RVFFPDQAQDDVPRLRARSRPMHPGAARLQFGGEFFQVPVQAINGLPFGLGGGLPRGFPALEGGAAFVPDNLVITQRRADDFPMTQVPRHYIRPVFELGNKAHEEKLLLIAGSRPRPDEWFSRERPGGTATLADASSSS